MIGKHFPETLNKVELRINRVRITVFELSVFELTVPELTVPDLYQSLNLTYIKSDIPQ